MQDFSGQERTPAMFYITRSMSAVVGIGARNTCPFHRLSCDATLKSGWWVNLEFIFATLRTLLSLALNWWRRSKSRRPNRDKFFLQTASSRRRLGRPPSAPPPCNKSAIHSKEGRISILRALACKALARENCSGRFIAQSPRETWKYRDRALRSPVQAINFLQPNL
jgi:hypothetical protein